MTDNDKTSAQVENEVPAEDDGTMSLTAHLEELRSRIIKSLLAVVVGSIVAIFFPRRDHKLLDVARRQALLHASGRSIFHVPKNRHRGGIFDSPARNFLSRVEIFLACVDKR